MDSRVSQLLAEIRRLETELEDAVREHEVQFLYRLEGTRVKFERAVRRAHRELKVGIYPWLRDSSLQNVVSAPFIYTMVVPFVILDLWISAYQFICFPLYGIPTVERRSYIAVDRHRLGYLNAIEKFNCIFCGYANGLLAYSREIAARTEEYWCPVKHARKILDPHRRYARFADYGDPEGYAHQLADAREASVD